MKSTPLIPALLALGLLPALHAAPVFSDTFADAVNWAAYGNTSPSFSSTDNVLSLAGGNNSHRYIRSNSFSEPVTLSAVGDIMTFSFRIRHIATATNNTNHEFNIGIGNNRGTTAINAPDAVDDLGYVANIGAGTGLSRIVRDAGTHYYLGRSTDDFTMLGADVPTGFGLAPASGFVNYTMTFERTLAGMDISLFNGTTLVERSDTAVPSSNFYTFNTIAVGYYKRAATTSLDLDSMSVTYTAIPEPGTLALIGISLGSLLLFRRRKG